jgi:hypothetical protein
VSTSWATATSLTSATSVWNVWNANSGLCHVNATGGTAGGVYSLWVQAAATTTITTYMNQTWRVWSDSPTTGAIARAQGRIEHVRSAPPPPTPEQLAERKRIEDAARLERLKAEDQRKASKARARKLLVEHLSAAQRETYERLGYFDVVVEGKHYRIEQGSHGNVRLLDAKGHTVESYCVQPRNVPDEDAMLSQKLALELAREEFFAKANVTRYPRN